MFTCQHVDLSSTFLLSYISTLYSLLYNGYLACIHAFLHYSSSFRMVTGLCSLPVFLALTWSSTRVLLDTVHVPSPVMLATPFVYTLTPTVTLADSVHVIEKV